VVVVFPLLCYTWLNAVVVECNKYNFMKRSQ
jgi:hypothetical protein